MDPAIWFGAGSVEKEVCMGLFWDKEEGKEEEEGEERKRNKKKRGGGPLLPCVSTIRQCIKEGTKYSFTNV